MPGLEASLETIKQMMANTDGCSFDVLAHGPLTGMLVEHCLLAMNMQHASKMDVCQMPCAIDQFALVDRHGNRRPVFTDRYCRNHIMLEHDVGMLPVLTALLALKPASLRIDARTYSPETIRSLVRLYKRALDSSADHDAIRAEFQAAFPASEHTYGSYLLGICHDDAISRLDLKREEHNER